MLIALLTVSLLACDKTELPPPPSNTDAETTPDEETTETTETTDTTDDSDDTDTTPVDTDSTDSTTEDTGPEEDTAVEDTGTTSPEDTAPEADVFEGWPATVFFPTYCGDCHPDYTVAQMDWTNYEHVVLEYDHIYCGVGLEFVPECEHPDGGEPHAPGHLPQEGGPQPTDEERARLIAWMDAGMPREGD